MEPSTPTPEPRSDTTPRFDRAVVIGASVSGLAAARVLSEVCREVLVVDRDARPAETFDPGPAAEPEGFAPRRGAPQGAHSHILLKGGQDVLEQLFPGILEEWGREGVAPLDFSKDVAWHQYGGWKPRFLSDFRLYPQRRPDLEARIRRRVRALDNVDLVWRTRASQLRLEGDGQVRGVRLEPVGSEGEPRDVPCQLVVDASGFGSRTPAWLEEAGYARPAEEVVPLGLTYTSAQFRPAPHAVWWNWRMMFVPPGPGCPRGGMISAVDEGVWTVSLYGYGGQQAPTDDEGFRGFAETLSSEALWAALAGAERLTPLVQFRVKEQRRRRYDRLARVPSGLLVMGDAVARVDPAYGQGMSAALLQASYLREELESARPLQDLTSRFHRAVARVVDVPWALANPRREGAAAMRAYRRSFLQASAEVPALHRTFLEVQQMTASPKAFFRPAALLRWARWWLAERRRRRAGLAPAG